ncbi:MAG: LytR/AlgR family response regulator transcription factor [Leadbetterella sp.]
MNKITCIAIDDEPYALEILADDLRKIPEIDLLGTYTSPREAQKIVQTVDLLFLDIEMPDILGTDFLKNLENPPLVIFTTAYEKYALQGYDLQIVDYLLKPYSFDRLKIAVNKVVDRKTSSHVLAPEKEHSFVIHVEYRQLNIISSQILYIEGLKDYVKIFLLNHPKPYLTRLNLKGIQSKLPQTGFCRVHNSYIVNLLHVGFYQKNKLFINNVEIPIGSKYTQEFEQCILPK